MKSRTYISTSDISISFNGIPSVNDGDLDKSHFHERYEILYISSGTGKYVVEGSEYDISPGTLIFVRPYEYHCMKLDCVPGVDYERYCIHFTLGALAPEMTRVLDKMNGMDGSGGNFFAPLSLPISTDALFDRLDVLEMLSDEDKKSYSRAVLTELIFALSVAYAEKRPDDEGELGARVIRYLNNNIHKNVSLEKLARRFFVSKYYLCRAFKKYNGISIHGYVNHKRVLYAKQLIDAGETASGAAYKVGFGDYSAFYRAYVKLVGKSPTAEQPRKEQE